ncbi:MAG: hypothetical protein ABH874_03505 [Methanobacteriota archaeon]
MGEKTYHVLCYSRLDIVEDYLFISVDSGLVFVKHEISERGL